MGHFWARPAPRGRRPRVRAGLERALRDAVRTGRLPPGTRLPSSRSLAADLGIARNTVADAYGQLVAEGWLDRAARVGHAGVGPGARAGRGPRPRADEAARLRYGLRPGSPDLSGVPALGMAAPQPPRHPARRRSTRSATATLAAGPSCARALAGYLARARGVRTSPERLVVCSGFTQGLALLCEVLRVARRAGARRRGLRPPAHRELAERAGLELRPLPVDAHGAARRAR